MAADMAVSLRLGYLFLTVIVLDLSKAATVQMDSGCGVTVGCFHDCSSAGTCTFLFTWVEEGDYIHLVLKCARSETDPYCAIGLSANLLMGDDNVFECLSDDGSSNIYMSYNTGNTNSRYDDGQFSLTDITTSYSNGILTCDFKRRTVYLASFRRKRAVVSASTYFDMNTDWYLLYAYGTNTGGTLNKHGTTPVVSSFLADFQSLTDITVEISTDKTLKRVHGILMVFAWVLFSTLGMFIARFYKKAWPEDVRWFGGQPWFVIHRVCMVLGLLLTAAGFSIIFVDVKKYSEIDGSTFQKSHPIVGIIVMGLMVINVLYLVDEFNALLIVKWTYEEEMPVIALFRPKPDHPKRIVFRVVHALIAVAAEVTAIVNLFSGTNLDSINISSTAMIVLGGYCAWYFIIQLGLLFFDCTQNDKNKTGVAHELTEPGERTSGDIKRKEREYNILKVVVLVVHILVQIGVAIVVSMIILDGDLSFSSISNLFD